MRNVDCKKQNGLCLCKKHLIDKSENTRQICFFSLKYYLLFKKKKLLLKLKKKKDWSWIIPCICMHYKKRSMELRFGASFDKNAASKSCLSCVLHKRSSIWLFELRFCQTQLHHRRSRVWNRSSRGFGYIDDKKK